MDGTFSTIFATIICVILIPAFVYIVLGEEHHESHSELAPIETVRDQIDYDKSTCNTVTPKQIKTLKQIKTNPCHHIHSVNRRQEFEYIVIGYFKSCLPNNYFPNDLIQICFMYYFNLIWEDICHPTCTANLFYSTCSTKTVKLRGARFNTDRIHIHSENENPLLSIANVEIFESDKYIYHFANHKASWFYKQRDSFPKNIFFMIFHLRIESIQTSVVQYFYIDKNKFNYLIENNDKIAGVAQQKGKGFFAINGKCFDESGLFWNFINGKCKYRNDRLKLLPRKHEGPWYLSIPTRPVLIGKQFPIKYYRAYNRRFLNSVKCETLYHDCSLKDTSDNNIPCDCNACEWIDTQGKYCEYIEIDMDLDKNSLAKNTTRIAIPLSKSLQIELHWTLQGHIERIEFPEMILANIRFIHFDLCNIKPLKD